MSATIEIKNDRIEMTSFCEPLTGIGLGVALVLIVKLVNPSLFNSTESANVWDFVSIFFMLYIANKGMPRKLIIDLTQDLLVLERYSFLRKKVFYAQKSKVVEVHVSDSTDTDSVKNIGKISFEGGSIYVYNLFAYLLSPQKHHSALRIIKEYCR